MPRVCAVRLEFVLGWMIGWAGFALAGPASAQGLVPGTGTKIDKVGDDFEDEKWKYTFNNPKASHEQDDQIRHPAGQSANARWLESAKRGHPDVIERVATPPDGIPGSKGSMKMQTLNSGVPGRLSNDNMQDDLICNVASRVGMLSVASSPSVVVRVAVPPFDEFEQRTGNTFGFRLALEGIKPGDRKMDTYWPGMFIYFYCKNDGRVKESYAQLLMRGGPRGHDFWGPKIPEPGWWTLGMSCTPDGAVHFYAHAGVEDLTAKDHISTQFPYGFRAERLQTFFFDVVNRDNGRSWSTPWIVDDPTLYQGRPGLTSQPSYQQPNVWRRGR